MDQNVTTRRRPLTKIDSLHWFRLPLCLCLLENLNCPIPPRTKLGIFALELDNLHRESLLYSLSRNVGRHQLFSCILELGNVRGSRCRLAEELRLEVGCPFPQICYLGAVQLGLHPVYV